MQERQKVLLIDHSGRGHAFADLFTRTNPAVHVYYAPGCPAIDAREERITSLPHLRLDDPTPMVKFAVDEAIDLVFVANTSALAAGFVDAFREQGLPVIGPNRRASRLEASKVDTKALCVQYGIPVAEHASFDDVDEARAYALANLPVVIKADGLCAGNGSFVCRTAEAVAGALDRVMVQREFGDAGDRVVVEHELDGIELLFFAVTDGEDHVMLPMATDYPWSDDGNVGVLCGGMGSCSPHPYDTPALREQFEEQVLRPVLRCIQGEGLHYTGVIYLGCMLVGDQLYLLEINVRMGEPEAETVLPRIRSDFYSLCQATLRRELGSQPPLELDDQYYCDVVATQGRTRQISNGKNKGWYKGWPYGRHGRGYAISGLEDVDPGTCHVYLGQASVHPEKGLVSDGARCVHIVGYGATHEEAVANAYANIQRVRFDGIRYRTDIGTLMPWDQLSPGALEAEA